MTEAASASAASLYDQGRYAQAAASLLRSSAAERPDAQTFSLLTRALANEGRLAEALLASERWIAADMLNSAAHYIRAMVLMELGHADDAKRGLQRTLYLNSEFVLAHFALGTLARSTGQNGDASRHFANALRLLERLESGHELPESDGLTAERLAQTIAALMCSGSAEKRHGTGERVRPRTERELQP